MPRKILGVVLAVLTLVALAPSGQASSDQIKDAAGDHPVPFMDITGVGLAVVQVKGAPSLQVTFTLAGPITPETRATQTGYTFVSKVGKCDLLVRFMGYPDGVFTAAGDVATRCGDDGRNVGGTFKIKDNTITVVYSLGDLKVVSVGQTMTKLGAFTSPVEGMYHDEGIPGYALGDNASSDKSWTIG